MNLNKPSGKINAESRNPNVSIYENAELVKPRKTRIGEDHVC